jgi:hypothetical protein
VQKNGGIIQTDLKDILSPSKIINETYTTLINANGKNINYYYSNRGMDLILRFIGIIHINMKLGNFKSTFEEALVDFNLHINKVLPIILNYYGAGAVAKSFDALFVELKKSSNKYNKIENDLRKLNFKK